MLDCLETSKNENGCSRLSKWVFQWTIMEKLTYVGALRIKVRLAELSHCTSPELTEAKLVTLLMCYETYRLFVNKSVAEWG